MINAIIFAIVFYIVGCILAFGMCMAFWYEIDEANIPWGLPYFWVNRHSEILFQTSFSWIAVMCEIMNGYGRRKYWLKFSYRSLRKKREKYLSENKSEDVGICN